MLTSRDRLGDDDMAPAIVGDLHRNDGIGADGHRGSGRYGGSGTRWGAGRGAALRPRYGTQRGVPRERPTSGARSHPSPNSGTAGDQRAQSPARGRLGPRPPTHERAPPAPAARTRRCARGLRRSSEALTPSRTSARCSARRLCWKRVRLGCFGVRLGAISLRRRIVGQRVLAARERLPLRPELRLGECDGLRVLERRLP